MGRSRKQQAESAVAPTRRAWFTRVKELFSRPTFGEAAWEELEELLVGADVGVATTSQLLQALRRRAQEERLPDADAVRRALQQEMLRLLQVPPRGRFFTDGGPPASPAVILMVGVNGTGKTTTTAKLGALLQEQGRKVLLAAADTFRAAAIEQLQVWGERAGLDVIAHQPGADPGAVVYDALEAARHRGSDVIIADTAGRLHTKHNLMDELKKVHRVVGRWDSQAPHEVLLVLDATMGQNALAQARQFTAAVGVTGIVLAKLDGTAKGGIVLAICHQLALPVLFIGTGEGLGDLAPFDAEEFVAALLA
ncbi:MAG: signal recognition particle-docking protein FtsY [Chloroflexi bacterium]|nr:signal recognition particle-docking protein FtsY [Chloroflexota bacterium]